MPPLKVMTGAPANWKVVSVLDLAAPAQSGGSSIVPFLMIALLFGVMYFMMIRPQQKRRREAERMQSALAPGDEVITIGGLYGTVVSVDDDTVTLEVAPGVQNRYARPAIARVSSRADQPAAEPAAAEPAADGGDAKD